jgi:hypothetical protein
VEAEGQNTAKRLRELRTRYAPNSLPEFETLRKEIEAASGFEEQKKFVAARRNLPEMKDVKRDLISVLPDDARTAYEQAAADKERFEKLSSEADDRAEAAENKLNKLDKTEENRVKTLTPALQATYKQLIQQVGDIFLSDTKSEAADAKLRAFRDARFSDLQAERKTAAEERSAASKQAYEFSDKADEAEEIMEKAFDEAIPGVKQWMGVVPLCTMLIRNVPTAAYDY